VPAIHLLISALCECGLFVFCFAYLSYLYFSFFFFMRLTFSSISSSISYLPEYCTRSVSRPEVVGGRRRPNLGLVCISLLLAVFLVKDA